MKVITWTLDGHPFFKITSHQCLLAYLSVKRFMSKVIMVPVSTWNTYNIFTVVCAAYYQYVILVFITLNELSGLQ